MPQSAAHVDAYMAFLETLPVAGLVADGETIVGANARAAALLGREPADLHGLPLTAVFPRGLSPSGADRLALPSSAPTNGHHETEILRGDGRSLLTDIALGRADVGGRPLVLAILRDDTDRARIEEERRTNEERLHAAILVAHLGFFDHDQVADTIYWSAEQRAIHGWGADEPISLADFARLVHPDDRAWVNASIARAHDPAGDGVWDVEHRIVRRDGTVRWLLARSQTFFEGSGAARRPVRTVGAVADITEQRAAADALGLFRISIDQASEAIFWLDRDGRFTYVNEEACQSLGYAREELLQLSVWDVDPVYPRDDLERRWAEFDRTRAPTLLSLSTMHRRKDGTTFPVEVLSQHLPVGDGSLHVAYVRDISERRRLEAQLLQAQKMESVGRLAGGVAHDFNNLLTAIQGNASLALLDVEEDGPIRLSLEEVVKASESAAKLTRQLLAFARNEVIRQQVLDLNAVVRNLSQMLARLLGEDVDVSLQLDPGLRPIRFDAGQLEQVLVNLAINARDAMPDGGRLTVRTESVRVDSRPGSQGPDPGWHAVLSVTDVGVGMSEEVRTHLFEPFFTTKEVGKGTGLGLAMVYGAVTMNGGIVEVESELGLGTTIRILLPTVDAAPDERAPVPAETLGAGTETILLVEDEQQVRDLAVTVLQRQGYTVIAVPSADEALRIASQPGIAIDMLVTDVVLPGMNGQALAQRVRATRPGIPVLYTSGYTRNVIVHHGVVDEGVEFLAKPYAISQLERRVREMLDAAG